MLQHETWIIFWKDNEKESRSTNIKSLAYINLKRKYACSFYNVGFECGQHMQSYHYSV